MSKARKQFDQWMKDAPPITDEEIEDYEGYLTRYAGKGDTTTIALRLLAEVKRTRGTHEPKHDKRRTRASLRIQDGTPTLFDETPAPEGNA